MSSEQQKQLIEIRKRKQELLLEIQVSNNYIMTIWLFIYEHKGTKRLVWCVCANGF